jgi:hypothetical protein
MCKRRRVSVAARTGGTGAGKRDLSAAAAARLKQKLTLGHRRRGRAAAVLLAQPKLKRLDTGGVPVD